MKKEELYKRALKAGSYARKEWVISAFSVVRQAVIKPAAEVTVYNDKDPILDTSPAYSIRYNRESTEALVPTDDGFEWVVIADAVPMTALFRANDPLHVTPDDIVNLSEPIDSTYGDLLFNYIALVHSFEDRIPYQLGTVNLRAIEKLIAKKMVDNESVSGVKPLPDQIPVEMYMKFGRCMGALAGYTQLFVPTLTAKSLSTNHAIIKRRGELLEEHKDRLHDPVVVSKIQNELIQMDKDNLKGDPSEGFFISNKTWGTARKRMFSIHGPEAGFNEGGNAELVVNSLNEGWDTTKLPAMFNSTRAGSFYRGALTALGGEAVKFFMLVFQNTSIQGDDCGTTLGRKRFIDGRMLNYYEGIWEMTPTGLVVLDEERLKKVANTTIMTRSPQFCKGGKTDYCAKCAGMRLAENPYSVGSEATAVASMFMSVMMASAHAKELKTAALDFKKVFR